MSANVVSVTATLTGRENSVSAVIVPVQLMRLVSHAAAAAAVSVASVSVIVHGTVMSVNATTLTVRDQRTDAYVTGMGHATVDGVIARDTQLDTHVKPVWRQSLEETAPLICRVWVIIIFMSVTTPSVHQTKMKTSCWQSSLLTTRHANIWKY